MNLNSKDKQTYWTRRAEQRLINAENLTSDMLVELRKTYAATIKSLEKEINAFYGKYATETGLDLTEVRKRLNPKELKDFKTQLKKYYDEVQRLGGYSPDTKLYLRELSAKAYISRLEELQAQMRWQVENLYRTQQLKIFNTLKQGYEDTYLRATFDMQQGIGFAYSFSTLDDNKVRLAVTQKWQGSNFSERIWADKARLIDTLNTTIPQGVALGQNPRKVAQTIAKSMNTRYSNAERLARTEMNNICNQATKQMYEETPEITEKYKFVATLDARTSDLCSSTDNKVFDVKEAEVGINYPPMHPNCRSTTVPYFEELENSQYTRIATDYSKNGQPYYVPANLSYTEWKNSLSEEQQKYFIADKKIRQQHNADKEQLNNYRKIQTIANKNGDGDLFNGMPTKLQQWQELKYLEPDKYAIYRDNYQKYKNSLK